MKRREERRYEDDDPIEILHFDILVFFFYEKINILKIKKKIFLKRNERNNYKRENNESSNSISTIAKPS